MGFTDYRKAFDFVDRVSLWNVLRKSELQNIALSS